MRTFVRFIITAGLSAAAIAAGSGLHIDLTRLSVGPVPAAVIAAAIGIVLLVWFAIAPAICNLLRDLRFSLSTKRKIRKQILSRQRSLLNWLLSRPAHWGITGTASEPQYANTCEALLALRGTGYYE